MVELGSARVWSDARVPEMRVEVRVRVRVRGGRWDQAEAGSRSSATAAG